jgi:hypothetical protein
MLGVVFTTSETAYGYPNLTDEEIRELLAVRGDQGSLGTFINTVIKPNHDHERVVLLSKP